MCVETLAAGLNKQVGSVSGFKTTVRRTWGTKTASPTRAGPGILAPATKRSDLILGLNQTAHAASNLGASVLGQVGRGTQQ